MYNTWAGRKVWPKGWKVRRQLVLDPTSGSVSGRTGSKEADNGTFGAERVNKLKKVSL